MRGALSVGSAGALLPDGAVDSVVVVVVLDGASGPLPLQPATEAADQTSTAAPATTRVRPTESKGFIVTAPIRTVWLAIVDGRLHRYVIPQNGDGSLGFEDGQTNPVGIGVPVFAQHRVQIRSGQSTATQVASVHLPVADQDHQRRIDEPAQNWNQSQSREDCMGGQKAQQARPSPAAMQCR
jgi:hypothetical protein